MAMVVVMTAAERAAVVGPSAVNSHCVMDPIPLTDGTFYIGVESLTDAVFASAKYAALKLKTPVDFTTLTALTIKAPVHGSGP